MLTQGEDVEAHALQKRGWTISAIARHLGRDRKTVRAYLNGERVPGVRARSAPDPLEPFTKYLAARFVDDPHVWASALYDEVDRLGYPLSYPSFARQMRLAGLRPHCEACTGREGPRHHRDRPPGRRGDPVGLVRAPRTPLGRDGLRAARHAAALGQGPRRAGRVDGPGPPHRGHGRGAAAPRRHGAGLADRPTGHGDRARAPATSRPPSPRWPSTTGPSSSPVRPGAATARGPSSPRCASSRAGGGAR